MMVQRRRKAAAAAARRKSAAAAITEDGARRASHDAASATTLSSRPSTVADDLTTNTPDVLSSAPSTAADIMPPLQTAPAAASPPASPRAAAAAIPVPSRWNFGLDRSAGSAFFGLPPRAAAGASLEGSLSLDDGDTFELLEAEGGPKGWNQFEGLEDEEVDLAPEVRGAGVTGGRMPRGTMLCECCALRAAWHRAQRHHWRAQRLRA